MGHKIHQQKLLPFLLLSLVIHLALLKVLELLPKNFLSTKSSSTEKENRPIKIRSIEREPLKEYRTVGVKNGVKDFSVPTAPVSTEKVKAIKSLPTSKKKLSLNSLQVTPAKIRAAKNRKMKRLEKEKTSKLKVTTQNIVQYERTKEVQISVLKQLAVSPSNASVLRKTGFNMQLEPPEGVSEDELNSMEKIYYSFQRRTFKSYVGSFLKTYKQMLLEHPSIKKTLKEDSHNLAARVLFDANGHIITIKILRSSLNDNVHNLFEKTLKGIIQLHNPPKDLLLKNGQFTIFYQLKIN